MLPSGQVLEISGYLNDEKQLEKAIDYAISLHGGIRPFERVIFQITEHKACCIGTYFENIDGEAQEVPEGWCRFSIMYEPPLVAKIVKQNIEQYSSQDGFLLKAVTRDDYMSRCKNTEIQNPEYGICCVWPYPFHSTE